MNRALEVKSFGYMLKSWRQKSGLAQQTAGAILGVNAAHVAFIESSMRRPSLPVLLKIASLINMDAREAFVLAYPEAKTLVGQTIEPVRKDATLFDRPLGVTTLGGQPSRDALSERSE
jgi:transcriptional regulator with XRE-family HTH domain